jgi:hypothetical protein
MLSSLLALTGRGILARASDSSSADVSEPASFDIDRVLNANPAEHDDANYRVAVSRYVANATISFLSIPLFSKACVGSGYAVFEEADREGVHALSFQFGAGSYPESAHGLNRLGFIQEAVLEERPGYPAECAWLAFMTTSTESNFDQAQKALKTSGPMVPYSASQGHGWNGSFASRVERLEFASQYTWRDLMQLVEKARESMTVGAGGGQSAFSSGLQKPGTFLYMVRCAMIDARAHTTGSLIFNKKQFQLDALKEEDKGATRYFAGKKLVPPSARVIRINATLTEARTGQKTPFCLWYEEGAEPTLPLRFEYPSKPFLRLTFEVDVKVDTPPIRFALKKSKENA